MKHFVVWRICLITLIIIWVFSCKLFSQVTVRSISTGNWTSPLTWENMMRSGSITTSSTSKNIKGVRTLFLTELSVGAIIKTSAGVSIGTIASITNDTTAVLSSNAASTNADISFESQGLGSGDNVVITSGNTVTFDISSLSCMNLTINGVFTNGANRSLQVNGSVYGSGAIQGNGNWDISYTVNWEFTGIFNSSKVSIIANGTGNQQASGTLSTFRNFIVDKSGGIFSISADVHTVNFSLINGIFNPSTHKMNFTTNGNFTGGVLIIDAPTYLENYSKAFQAAPSTGTEIIYTNSNAVIDSSIVYYHITYSGAGTATLGGNVMVNGNVKIQSGVLDVGNNNFSITVGGNWINNGGDFNGRLGVVKFTGVSNTIGGTAIIANFAFINIASGAGYTVNTHVKCLGLLFLSGINSSSLTLTNNRQMTINGNVVINQPSGAAQAIWNINNGIVTVSGSISLAGVDTTSSRIAKVTINNGTLNANGGISFSSGSAKCHVIDMSGGAGIINLRGALFAPVSSSTLLAGTVGSVFNYQDSLPQTITFFSEGAYHNLYINNTSNNGAVLSKAITVSNVTGNIRVGNLNVGSYLSTENYNINFNGNKGLFVAVQSKLNAGTSIISFLNDGFVNVDGVFQTNNLNGFSGSSITSINSNNIPVITLGSVSIINYAGNATQKISGRIDYAFLTLSGTGSKIIDGDMVINRALNITGGDIYNVSFRVKVKGNITNFSTQSGNGLIILTGGSASHFISGSGSFANIEINDSLYDTYLNNDIIVNAALFLTIGKIVTGTHYVIISGASNVLRGKGYVNGFMRRFIQNVLSPTVAFDIGDDKGYAPVTISFTGLITGSGYLDTYTTPERPPLASGISQTNFVNRKWVINNFGVSGFSSYSPTFTFINADLEGSPSADAMVIREGDINNWDTVETVIVADTTAKALVVASFSNFYIGERLGKPIISTQPTTSAICEGTNINFISSSSTQPTPAKRWQRSVNGITWTNIIGNLDSGVNYWGFNTDTLLLTGVNNVINGYRYRAVYTNINGASYSNEVALNIKSNPTIIGNRKICLNQSNSIKVLDSLMVINSWLVSDTTIAKILGTGNSISILGKKVGNAILTCMNNNACSSIDTVFVQPIPGTLTTIYGPQELCNYFINTGFTDTVYYHVNPVQGATHYNWIIPRGSRLVKGAGSDSIGLIIDSTLISKYGQGWLWVGALSDQGCASNYIGIRLYRSVAYLYSYSGPTNICPFLGKDTVAVYSVVRQPQGYGYLWEVPTGVDIVSPWNPFDSNVIQVKFTNNYISGNIQVRALAHCGNSGLVQFILKRTAAPIPGVVSGPSNPCTFIDNAIEAIYSIRKVAGATAYNWRVPTGATITGHPGGSGINDTSIKVVFTNALATSDTIKVQSLGCLPSAFRNFILTQSPPAVPLNIFGPTDVCSTYLNKDSLSDIVIYRINKVANASTYTWAISPDIIAISSIITTDTFLIVRFRSLFSSGSIAVKANNYFGSSGVKSISIKKNITAMPASIQNSFTPNIQAITNVAGINQDTLKIRKVSSATGYYWNLKVGSYANVTHLNALGINDTAVIIGIQNGFTKDTISVCALSTCSVSSAKILALSAMAPPPNPTAISGNITPCINDVLTYAAAAPIPTASQAPVVKYRWTVPVNTTIVTATPDSAIVEIKYNPGFTGGNISVKAISATGVLSSSSFLTTLKYLPATPVSITSSTNDYKACIGSIIQYKVVMPSLTQSQRAGSVYRWTKPKFTTINSATSDSSAILLRYDSGFTGGTIGVKAQTECGVQGATKTIALIFSLPPTPTSIISSTGNFNACPEGEINYNLVVPSPLSNQQIAQFYRWSIPNNSFIASANVDSSVITLHFNKDFSGGSLSVKGQTSCGGFSGIKSQILTHTGCTSKTYSRSNVESNDYLPINNLEIYPNPSNGNFTVAIKMNDYLTTKIKIEIIDCYGRIVLQRIEENKNGLVIVSIEGKGFLSGVYILKCYAGKDTKIAKVTVIKN